MDTAAMGHEPTATSATLPSAGRTRRRRRVALVVGLCAVDLGVFWEWWNVTRLDRWTLASPAISVLTFVALLRWGWRAPVSVFATVWIISALSELVPGYHPFLAALYGLYLVAVQRPTTVSVPALGSMVVMSLLLEITTLRQLGQTDNWVVAAVFPALLWSLIAALVWAVGVRARVDRQRVTDLQERRVADAAAAVANERLRIARDLHDIVAHSVSVMVLQAAGARRVMAADPERADRALSTIEQTGMESMQELRRLLGVLRASGDEDNSPDGGHQPGLSDLAALVDLACRTGLTATLEVTGSPCRLDPSVELAAYRVVQESLTNARKHAGEHVRATVRLTWTSQALTVSVDDEPFTSLSTPPGSRPAGGQPAAAAPPGLPLSMGHGLLGLRERVTAIGGTFAAGPTASGFRVTAVLPCSTVTDDAGARRVSGD
jgi:signal transduction histidine kinase